MFTTPTEKQAHIDAVKLVALDNARTYVSKQIEDAEDCRLDLTFENSEISFIIEDELVSSGWLCTFRDACETGKEKVKTFFVPGAPRKRYSPNSRTEVGNPEKCTNCGKGPGRHFDDDDRPTSDRRNYCFKRGEEKQNSMTQKLEEIKLSLIERSATSTIHDMISYVLKEVVKLGFVGEEVWTRAAKIYDCEQPNKANRICTDSGSRAMRHMYEEWTNGKSFEELTKCKYE